MNVRCAWTLGLVLVGCALDSGNGNAGSGGTSGISGSGGSGGTGGITVDAGSVCGLPFEVGECDAAIPVWAFSPELGGCFIHIYGGCGGNANNFPTRADCEAACPISGSCPPNRIGTEICLQCGPGGGCVEHGFACALICGGSDECASDAAGPISCVEGVCQVGPCI